MRVKIEIECEDLYEVNQHLLAIRAEMVKANKLTRVAQLKGKIAPDRSILTDNNCYGTHRAVFTNEDKTAQT